MGLAGLLKNIRALGSDPKAIVMKFSNIIFIEEAESEAKKKYEQLQSNTEELEKYAAIKKQAIRILSRLSNRGISEQDVCNVLDIIEQHIEHMTIAQLTKHIDIYGNMRAAIFRLRIEENKLESENQMLKSSNHATRVQRSYLT